MKPASIRIRAARAAGSTAARATGSTAARAAVGTVCIAVVASGCGGSMSDSDKVKSTVSTYFFDVGNGKGDKACALMTDSAVQEVSSAVALLRPPSSCADAITSFDKLFSADDKKGLKAAKVTRVTVTANTATVADNDIQLKAGGELGLFRNRSPKPMTLEKIGGDWKISSLG